MQKFELKEKARLLEKCAVTQPARMQLTSPAREQSDPRGRRHGDLHTGKVRADSRQQQCHEG